MSKKSTNATTQFALLRKQSGLSYRRMELVTGIKYSALAAMENGNRPIGEQSARRIATAFDLSDDARERFVLSALNTSRERVLESTKNYPSQVLNHLALLLMSHGIRDTQIANCQLDGNKLEVTLKNGRRICLETKITSAS